MPLHPWPPSENSLKPTCTPKHIHPSLNHPPGVLRGVRPLLCPWTQNFVDCFLFCCALESSCLGRLSAIKVQLELEFSSIYKNTFNYSVELYLVTIKSFRYYNFFQCCLHVVFCRQSDNYYPLLETMEEPIHNDKECGEEATDLQKPLLAKDSPKH